jgi:hypothetical protein
MHNEERLQVFTAEKRPRYGSRRENIFGLHLKAELRQIADDASKRTTGRIGDELQGNLRRPNFPDRIERARQNRVTDIHNAVEVEQHASYFMDATHRPRHQFRRLRQAPLPQPQNAFGSPAWRRIALAV